MKKSAIVGLYIFESYQIFLNDFPDVTHSYTCCQSFLKLDRIEKHISRTSKSQVLGPQQKHVLVYMLRSQFNLAEGTNRRLTITVHGKYIWMKLLMNNNTQDMPKLSCVDVVVVQLLSCQSAALLVFSVSLHYVIQLAGYF